MADIFISYSKARAGEAGELARELADLGYAVWWDISLLPTGSFGAAIDRELDAAKAVIVIWSPESARSKWVLSEARHADRQAKLVNTHTSEIADPSLQIPKPFGEINSVLIDDIRRIVGALDLLNVPRSGGAVLAPESAVRSVAETDDRLFAEVEASGTAEAYEFYLGELPQGAHAALARFRLKGLQGQAAKPAAIGVKYKPGDIIQDAPYAPRMIVVPGGIRADGKSSTFMMGSPNGSGEADERPQHRVTIPAPFAVGIAPVTRGEYAAFVKATKLDMGSGLLSWMDSRWPFDNKLSWRNPEFKQSDDHPVVFVSWEDAKAYADWLSQPGQTGKPYRLLTEAEWEYCCRADTATPYWSGETITPSQANFGQNEKGTTPVTKYAANPWELRDVHGNVWEWCADTWHENYEGNPPTDGSEWRGGNASFRVLRGGSWNYNPQFLRSASRNGYQPVDRSFSVGFRLARTLLPL